MNTDIVHWKDNKRDFQIEALKPYLYLTLPITFFVVTTWGVYQFLKKRKEEEKLQQQEAHLNQPDV